jgi:hypothetical protein
VSITRNAYIKTLPEQTVNGMAKVEAEEEKVNSTLVQ